jgi:hypothetical protein
MIEVAVFIIGKLKIVCEQIEKNHPVTFTGSNLHVSY